MRLIKAIKHTPMILVLIFILIFLTPMAIFSPGENKNRAVVTAVGIDKIGQEYEISFLTFIPTANQTYKETNSVISGKGNSVAEAVYEAQLSLGREIGLSHAKTTVVNESLFEEDVTTCLDYLSRIASLSENTIFICTNASAKDFLKASQSLDDEVGLKLEQLINYNATNIYVSDTSLDAFYKGYFGPEKASIVGYLSLESGQGDASNSPNSEQSGSGSASQGSPSQEGGSASGSGGEEKKQILNKVETILVKEGKLAQKIDDEILNGINLLNKDAKNQTIYLENVSDEIYDNDDLSYTIKNKKVLISTRFENGYPIFCANIIIGVRLDEINNSGKAKQINTEFSKITPTVEKRIKDKLKSQFSNALKVLRQNKTDVIGVYQTFEKEDRKNFYKFLKNLPDSEDFLSYVTFQLVVKVQTE